MGGNGSWPQAKKGNDLATTHGAWSQKVVDPVARDLVSTLLDQVGYLSDPSYQAAVWAWARHEACVLTISAWLEQHGHLDEDGNPRPAVSALKDFERLAASARTRLGLDPLSRAQLGRDIAAQQVDLARIFDEMEEKK
jgi:hypothetical protein